MPYADLLTDAEIADGLRNLPAWQREGDVIRRTLRLADFRAAIAFVERVADVAERANHHPEIAVRWNRVTLTLTTHAAKGLTRRDFDVATEIDRLVT
jgi:4a-hydroxytetrahydrobiopterin dehydratase